MKVVVTKELNASQMHSSLKRNGAMQAGMIFYNMIGGNIPVLTAFFQYNPTYHHYSSEVVEHSPILGVPAEEDVQRSILIDLRSDLVEWTE